MMYSHEKDANFSDYETLAGTRVTAELLDAARAPLSGFVSESVGQKLTVGPVDWRFSGHAHEEAAQAVAELLNRTAQREPGEYTGYGTVTIPLKVDEGGVVFDATTLVIASGLSHTHPEVDRVTTQLVRDTNDTLRALQSEIQLIQLPA